MKKSQNRAKTGKRAPSTAWKPGQSGNPGGRPKTDPELVEAFRDRTPKALAALDKVVDDFLNPKVKKKPQAKDVVAASKVMLDRAWGTATTNVKLDGAIKAEVKGEVKHGAAEAKPFDEARLSRIAGVLVQAGVVNLAALVALGDSTDAAAGGGGPGTGDADAGAAGGAGAGAGEAGPEK